MRTRMAALLVVLGVFGCGGSSVSVVGPGDGKVYVSSEGGVLPPAGAVVSKKGIEPPPTATPGQPTPIYPVGTPAPAPTVSRTAPAA